MQTEVRVMIVDDEAADREWVRRLLTDEATTPFFMDDADGLAAAVERLRNNAYDVLLLDLNLPESRGPATLDAIRRENDDLPIIVLTGLSDEDTALRALEQGAQDYLIKGCVTAQGLAKAIRYAVQRQHWLRELSSAKRQLEQKNRRLAELYDTAYHFVDHVSHEFRTPLTVIKEYASLIRDGLAESVEMRNRFLDIVKDRADDLNTIVDDMLDMSRLEAGLLGLWRRNYRIGDVVEDLRPALERKAAVKGVTLEVRVDPGLPEAYCDPEKIGRVLINLTINAVKFCRQQGHVLIWATENPDAPGLVVGVTDDGPGIDRENLTKIFERFRQLSGGGRCGCKGFGLGLSIAKELVDLHFGELTVESEVGRGSTFRFTLPPADPPEVMRRYLRHFFGRQADLRRLSLVTAVVTADSTEEEADEIGAFLFGVLRRNDLTFRLDERTWLVVLEADERELSAFYDRTSDALKEINRNRIQGPLPTTHLRTLGTWDVADDAPDWFVRAWQGLTSRSAAYV